MPPVTSERSLHIGSALRQNRGDFRPGLKKSRCFAMDDVQVALLARLRIVRIHKLQHFSFGDHIGHIRHNLHHAL